MNSWIPCAFSFSMICHTEYFPYLICISDIDEGEDSNVWHFRKWWKDVPIGIKINLLCHREIRSVSCSVPSPVYNSRDMYTSFWWYMYYDDICKHKHITQNKCKRLQKWTIRILMEEIWAKIQLMFIEMYLSDRVRHRYWIISRNQFKISS